MLRPRTLLALIGLSLSCLTMPAHAVADNAMAICAAMDGALDRLSCFDKLAEANQLSRPQNVPVDGTGNGKWRVSKTVNPIDDSTVVTLILEADSGEGGYNRAPVTFVARCMSKKTEAYISWNDYLGDDSQDVYNDWKNVTIRIGRAAAKVEHWSISTDSKATFAPEWAGALLKEMAGSDKLIAQVTPYNESPTTAVFDTTGMRSALAPLMSECDWQMD